MTATRKLWLFLIGLLVISFTVLLWVGGEIHRVMPPIPNAVVTQSGETLYTRAEIQEGRQVWQSIGGHQLGSIWGHGSYVAPDWSADWLHRETTAWLDLRARAEMGRPYAELGVGEQARLQVELRPLLRGNGYDASTGTLVIPAERAQAIRQVAQHYDSLFSADPATRPLRETYAMREDTVPDPEHRAAMAAFFFWTRWAASTDRSGTQASYTNNWPYEPLIGNSPTSSSFLWTVFSIIFMIAGIGLLGWHYAVWHVREPASAPPARDPLAALQLTPSMRATAKYFWVVIALFLVQILLGAVTAHYQVEGQEAYGLAISEVLPYSLTRTWHTQLAVLWIATAWLGTGLFIGPAVSGHEPKYQRLGVNFLFGCLLVIVVGAFAGQWLAVMQKLGLARNFWFGHQGWEYTDIGRFWQIFLFVGLMLWLTLVGRALWPALRRRDESSSIVGLLFLSTIAIGLLYGAGLMWREHSHIAVVEYWRWWVVHLWVEGFFEVFATAVLAFLFVRWGLVRTGSATRATLAATTVFLLGGIPGTFHHLYFSGTPISITAIGSVFSALEVVPLVLIGREAMETLRMRRRTPWMARYRWPLTFFVAVAFWNLVGAGLFGFLINPPIALYFMQGLNTTPVHGHTALFGVYGLLALGLMLLVARSLGGARPWRDGALRYAFWAMNVGLALMVVLSLLPIGLAQTWASVERGLWYARSAEFLQLPALELLRWLRIVGDTLFLTGVASLTWFFLGLWTGRSYLPETASAPAAEPRERVTPERRERELEPVG
jgi:nitric oxide reductase subunit B